MSDLMIVRLLQKEETESALRLAWQVFTEYESPDYAPEGTDEFKKALNDDEYLSEIRYYGAFDGNRLVGILGIREEKAHICFFFVDGAYHRRGIGTRLFERMREDFAGRTVTLNSSPYGLPFYKALGFTPTDKEQTINGIRFTPMVFSGKGEGDVKDLVLYIHGQGGCAVESEHYKPLFPDYEVLGLDYQTFTPWETGEEIRDAVESLHAKYKSITLIANSIGAFFSMHAGVDRMIRKAYFISPIVDMEQLILSMMSWADVTEKELEEKGVITTTSGETLFWDYLRYVREHPVRWIAPTRILYGSQDNLTSYETVSAFAEAHGAELAVMEGGEHWFHTEEQMRFLDQWILRAEKNK